MEAFLFGVLVGIFLRDLPGMIGNLRDIASVLRSPEIVPTPHPMRRITVSEAAEVALPTPVEPNLETWGSAIDEIAEKNQDFFNPKRSGKPEDTYV